MRTDKYTTGEDVEQLEQLADRLTHELRRGIRVMGHFPVFSTEWLSMAETVGRLATITDMEAKLPKKDRTSTLWESEELGLRYVVEDGKLNLSIRNLIDYKQFQLGNPADTRLIIFQEKSDKFEKGLGVMLKHAWKHIEVAQTTDIPAIFAYFAWLLAQLNENSQRLEDLSKYGDLRHRQESLVFEYLRDIMELVEILGEDRVMREVVHNQVFALAVQTMNRYHTLYDTEVVEAAALAFSFITATEYFSTYQDDIIPREFAEELFAFEDNVLQPLISTNPRFRPKCRSLLDAIHARRRQLGRK